VLLGNRVIAFDLDLPRPRREIDWLWLTGKTNDSVKFVRGNITDLQAILQTVKENGITKIVHAAVVNDLETLRTNPLFTLKVNVEGTLNALEAARIFELEKIVLTSSISVYAPKQYEPMDERHPVMLPDEGPTLFSYSSSKLSAEAFGLHYWSTYGVDFLALRFSALYGLGMNYPMYVKPMIENSVLGRDTFFESGKDAARDYTCIDDAVHSIELALNKTTKNRIFNVATGHTLQTPFNIAQMVMALQPSAKIMFGEGCDPVEERTVKTRGVLSIESAKQELGFSPGVSLEQGVADYFQSYERFIRA
jgi:UDP-glucose 4-epimerase/UDP-glucuronate 4-epimerase